MVSLACKLQSERRKQRRASPGHASGRTQKSPMTAAWRRKHSGWAHQDGCWIEEGSMSRTGAHGAAMTQNGIRPPSTPNAPNCRSPLHSRQPPLEMRGRALADEGQPAAGLANCCRPGLDCGGATVWRRPALFSVAFPADAIQRGRDAGGHPSENKAELPCPAPPLSSSSPQHWS